MMMAASSGGVRAAAAPIAGRSQEWDNGPMEEGRRPLRADAERNRTALLEAATAVFREHGLEVGISEIAQRAEVGRGTVFRHFPTKEHLIAAVVVERMGDAVAHAKTLLDSADPGEAIFSVIEEMAERNRLDRALFEALDEEWMGNAAIRQCHTAFLETIATLLQRAQEAGTVRLDVGPVDVLLMFKGICEVGRSFPVGGPELSERHVDLVRAALRPSTVPLRGRMLTQADLEEALDRVTGTQPSKDETVPAHAS
jgi:AcrR family transcriptional regulator